MGLGAMTWRGVAANQQLHHIKAVVRQRGAEKKMRSCAIEQAWDNGPLTALSQKSTADYLQSHVLVE